MNRKERERKIELETLSEERGKREREIVKKRERGKTFGFITETPMQLITA